MYHNIILIFHNHYHLQTHKPKTGLYYKGFEGHIHTMAPPYSHHFTSPYTASLSFLHDTPQTTSCITPPHITKYHITSHHITSSHIILTLDLSPGHPGLSRG